MIGVYAHAIVKPECTEAFEELAHQLVEKSQQEEGLLSYEYGVLTAESTTDEGQATTEFAFIERWESFEALEAHMETEHYKEADANAPALLATPLQINIYEL